MIAKRIARTAAARDNFKALAQYIAGGGQKTLWISNCDAGVGHEDLEVALAEIEATRAMNLTETDKTYHLIVSFQSGERPGPEAMKDIERAFATALGYEAHQRVAATHADTGNFHLHVAIDKVHPETLLLHTPWNDYKALQATCRAMERQYGLQADVGLPEGARAAGPRLSTAARDYEAHTWQESFQSHVLGRKAEILAVARGARSWAALHQGLAAQELEIRPRGNGLAVRRLGGREAIKASLIGRALAKPALEKRLGPYAPPAKTRRAARRRYRGRPLTPHPATARLWQRFLAGGRTAPRAANWKSWLLAAAYRDPQARMIVLGYRALLAGLAGPPRPRHDKGVSRRARH